MFGGIDMKMTTEDVEPLLEASERLVAETDLNFWRYLCEKIDWKDRLICIKGPKGTGKTFKQITDISDSYVVNDDVETGAGNKIPLWLFGFLY